MESTTKPMRADARRNRDKLLAAALDVFTEQGADASLDAVAKRAGVGVGTLYRHFPTRDALVEATYQSELERLHEGAGELLAEHPADEALALWLDRFVEYAMAKRGMAGALQAVVASGGDPYGNARGKIGDAVTRLLEAGQADGLLRSDVDAEDLWRGMAGVFAMPDEPDWPQRARTLLGLLMDGLRHRG